jgi:hypothetical protein
MNMFTRRKLVLALLVAAATLSGFGSEAQASYRQRYSTWSYYPQSKYYYSHYYYKPHSNYSGYNYHYCIYYPGQRYVYYYNPVRRVYWGRYDLEAQGYSLLAEKDRKANLEEIPEDAFPKPGEMPTIPDAQDEEKIDKISKEDLPTAPDEGKTPEDLPQK